MDEKQIHSGNIPHISITTKHNVIRDWCARERDTNKFAFLFVNKYKSANRFFGAIISLEWTLRILM